jgi:hypothetical protein
MNPINDEQKQLLFDYAMGLTSPDEAAEAEVLISSSKEASDIYSNLKAALSPLNQLKSESCPDNLADRTVWRLKMAANSSHNRLDQLLADEQRRAARIRTRHWHELGKKLAIAALFMIVGSTLFASFQATTWYARDRSQRQLCKVKQGNIFQGLSNFKDDNGGKVPAFAATSGSPWWKVGDQGSENHSNTRNLYVLVKDGYANLSDFVCPGSGGKIPELTPSEIRNYKDFPERDYVTYSFQITSGNNRLQCQKVIMADRNPLFETLPSDYNKPLSLRLNKTLSNINSINHGRRGQNALFDDGHVQYLKTRRIGIAKDDIYTVQNTYIYQGCEVPSNDMDLFLAP